MLYMLDNALKNGDKWLEFLYAYNWFPKGLAKLGDPKRLACWNYLLAQEPSDPAVVCTEAGRHAFWMRGYTENKVKEDRIVNGGGLKVINYSSFRDIIRQAVRESSQKSLGPIEMGNLTRRHWNGLKEQNHT